MASLAFEREADRPAPRSSSSPRRGGGVLEADLGHGLAEALEHGFGQLEGPDGEALEDEAPPWLEPAGRCRRRDSPSADCPLDRGRPAARASAVATTRRWPRAWPIDPVPRLATGWRPTSSDPARAAAIEAATLAEHVDSLADALAHLELALEIDDRTEPAGGEDRPGVAGQPAPAGRPRRPSPTAGRRAPRPMPNRPSPGSTSGPIGCGWASCSSASAATGERPATRTARSWPIAGPSSSVPAEPSRERALVAGRAGPGADARRHVHGGRAAGRRGDRGRPDGRARAPAARKATRPAPWASAECGARIPRAASSCSCRGPRDRHRPGPLRRRLPGHGQPDHRPRPARSQARGGRGGHGRASRRPGGPARRRSSATTCAAMEPTRSSCWASGPASRALVETALEWSPVGVNLVNALSNLAIVEIETRAGEAGRTAARPPPARARDGARRPGFRADLPGGGVVRPVARRPRGCPAGRRPGLEPGPRDRGLGARGPDGRGRRRGRRRLDRRCPGAVATCRRSRRPGAAARSSWPRPRSAVREAGVAAAFGSRREADAHLALARAYRARIEGRDEPVAWDALARTWERLERPYQVARARWRQAEAALGRRRRTGRPDRCQGAPDRGRSAGPRAWRRASPARARGAGRPGPDPVARTDRVSRSTCRGRRGLPNRWAGPAAPSPARAVFGPGLRWRIVRPAGDARTAWRRPSSGRPNRPRATPSA